MKRHSGILVVALVLLAGPARADEERVAARWDFGPEETTPLRPHGALHRDVPGPRPPEYPDFAPGNTAVQFDGRGAYLSIEDEGAVSPFDFTNGDAIGLEAWVKVDDLRAGENCYIIGKGRTGAKGSALDNQNWALRVRGQGGKACLSFLFATERSMGDHWHRWTTAWGFSPGSRWHHVAVTYQFGKPESARGWIDGRAVPGRWDMGGATEGPPVVDDDSVWIGSSMGGNASSSFRGAMDSVAVHRRLLTDEEMKGRYRSTLEEIVEGPAPETMPALGELPKGKVRLSVSEGMPAHDRWLNLGEKWPAEVDVWETEAFLMDRLPRRYEEWGILDSWKPTVLVRMAADVDLAPGTRRILMRVRGLSRLWVDGKLVARSGPVQGSPSGEEPVTPVGEPPKPGLRVKEHRQQEVFAEVEIGSEGPTRVVLETLVGGKRFRADPGETCVAVESEDGTSFVLLSPGEPIALTDEEVEAALRRQELALRKHDDRNRRERAASQDEFWERRHEAGREWVRKHPAPEVPEGAEHPVDAFLMAKIEHVRNQEARVPEGESERFHQKVLPILRDRCFRCHGGKEKGGLRLDSRERALKGGLSEVPAVVPGEPEESELIFRVKTEEPSLRMPPDGEGLKPDEVAVLVQWVKSGVVWPASRVEKTAFEVVPEVGDAAFLRRVYLDTVGVPPGEEEVREFLADRTPEKRMRVIDRLMEDDRWADGWMGYWQDVLAENPTLINASLNTTGPFRGFLHDSFRDGKAFDRMVTELILLRGSPHEGGSAGFGIAANNDAPFAAKGQIVAGAFLGIEMQCARCHDAPYHSSTQKDLYSLAAMFARKPVSVPKSSRVPAAFFESKGGRESLIKVTLKPDEVIPPGWPFEELSEGLDEPALDLLMRDPDDSRERLAALVTAPRNSRFARVVVDRVWRRYLGAGFVEPPWDWEGHEASHPELMEWLAKEFVSHDYDLKCLSRLILTSKAYQREAKGENRKAGPDRRFFSAPDRRRLTAEQVVDSLYASAGQRMEVEELTFDPDGRRAASNRLTLGKPRRAWMFASLANERDRPSLSLPRARVVADVLQAFGWNGSRQNPRTDRESAPSVLQPGVLANSTASVWLTRAALGSGLADSAVSAESPEALVDSVFLRYLGRYPTEEERGPVAWALSEGFDDRTVPEEERVEPRKPERLPRVTWSNHLRAESNEIALEMDRRARQAPPADPRLRGPWRKVYEDVVWGVVNTREFVWVP